jgi:hypothetical protein
MFNKFSDGKECCFSALRDKTLRSPLRGAVVLSTSTLAEMINSA